LKELYSLIRELVSAEVLTHNSDAGSASLRVLQLPELVIEVVQHLQNDRTALYAAIRVSRVMFFCGMRPLWSTPPSRAWTKVALDRRQFYANNIRIIDAKAMAPQLLGLQLPNLTTISLGLSASGIPLANPLVCAFNYVILRHVFAQRPRLKSLELYFGVTVPRRASLLQFIQELPSPILTKVALLGPLSRQQELVDELFSHFAQRPGLEDFSFWNGAPSAPANASLASKASRQRPFQQLQKLSMIEQVEGVSELLHTARPALSHLHLFVRRGAAAFSALSAISAPLALRELRLDLEGDEVAVPEAGIRALASMTQLVQLEILGPSTLTMPGLGFEHALQRLGSVQVLNLTPAMGFAADIFARIGAWCPLLRELSLAGTHDLAGSLRGAPHAPLFPRLEKLVIANVTSFSWDDSR
jgi:hypothetical protein